MFRVKCTQMELHGSFSPWIFAQLWFCHSEINSFLVQAFFFKGCLGETLRSLRKHTHAHICRWACSVPRGYLTCWAKLSHKLYLGAPGGRDWLELKWENVPSRSERIHRETVPERRSEKDGGREQAFWQQIRRQRTIAGEMKRKGVFDDLEKSRKCVEQGCVFSCQNREVGMDDETYSNSS